MTHPATPAPAPGRVAVGAYVHWLLEARADPGIRSDLRRGQAPTLEHYAYKHLTRWWSEIRWARTPLLLHAAAAATYHRLPAGPQQPIGRLAHQLTRSDGGLRPDSVEKRLIAVQRQTLPNAHRLLAGLYAAATQKPKTSLDWTDLAWTYLRWDHPDPVQRRDHRRRLLHEFYLSATP